MIPLDNDRGDEPMRPGFGDRVKERRKALGLSQVEVGEAVGRHGSAVAHWERSVHAPRLELPKNQRLIHKLATVLQCTAEWLIFGTSDGKGVPLLGVVAAGGIVVIQEGQVLLAPPPPGEPVADGLVAFAVDDTSNSPVYRSGDIIYVDKSTEDQLSTLVGEDCVVELSDGRQIVRQLMPGSSPSNFTLQAYNAATIIEVPVARAWPIVAVVRRKRRT